jgi:small subunit ribosomal protein S6
VTRDYELGFILAPEVNEEQTRGILGRVGQIVAARGGEIVRVNHWGRRRMAYPIEHHRDGYYVFVDMIAAPETIAELERNLRVSEEVLRHLITRRDPRTAQKEREAAANAAATAAATPTPAPAAEEAAPAEETDADEAAVVEEAALPEGVSSEDIADVPPAVEEPAEA